MKTVQSTKYAPATLAVLIAVALAVPSTAAQTLDDVLATSPVVHAQTDGVFCLGANAAAIIKWNGKQAALVNEAPNSLLEIVGGAIVKWNGDNERPTWRIEIPAAATYRVIVNHATPVGQEATASLFFFGKGKRAINVPLEPSLKPNGIQSLDAGEIKLEAGITTVEFQPTRWKSPFALGWLADVRLIPLDGFRSLIRPASDAMNRLGIDQLPNVAPLAEKVKTLRQELDTLNRETRRRDFSGFTDFNQFFEFDRLPPRLAHADQEFKDASKQLDSLRIDQAKQAVLPGSPGLEKLKPGDLAALEEFFRAGRALIEAETKGYSTQPFPPKAQRDSARASERKPLFPTGRFDELPAQPIDEKLPVVRLKFSSPPDASQRLERFGKRNSDDGLTSLCGELQKILIPGTPGLEEFERHARAGKPRDALNAYRGYFFDKLANPEKYGAATENILFELARDRGKSELLLRPGKFVVDENLNNAAVVQVGKEVVVGEVGAPGAVAWVPYGLTVPEAAANSGRTFAHAYWQTPAGKEARRTLEFYRCLTALPGDRAEYYSGGLFPALLWSYAINGDKARLNRWCEYLDDWALNARRDQDNFAFGVRNAMDLETQFPRCTLNLLRIVLDERPELARDFDSATLVRLLMKLVTDYAPYTIRARRAEMANWGIMGLSHQLHLGRFLHEFKAMSYFNREAWRLWNANMIQHRTLDGENIEAWDDGHNFVTIEFCDDSVPFARLPAETDKLDLVGFWDHVKTDQRSKLVHISPGGNYWPLWEAKQMPSRNTIRRSYRSGALNRNMFDLIDSEAGTQSRLQTLIHAGHPVGAALPDRTSDVSPYASMVYLRESWQPEADYLILQNFRTRSQAQDDCSRTMFSLSKSDRILVEAHGLVVDRKPDNRYQDAVRTGGKTDYCGQAGRHVCEERFHTSARFDFGEAKQDSPYALHRLQYGDPYGLYRQAEPAGDPEPIRDVTVLRQVFGLRGEGLWITCDRIDNRGPEREYTQFYTLPVRIEEAGFADRVRLLAASPVPLVETNESRQRIRTASPGFENVSLYCFGSTELKFASVLDGKRQHTRLAKSPLETVQAALQAGKTPDAILKQPIRQPVSVRWTGAGSQVFVTALATRPAVFDKSDPYQGDLREIHELKAPGGVLGCRAVTRGGSEVWFASGPRPKNFLTCGPVTAEAESLLVIKPIDGVVRGIVLGCASLTLAGRKSAVASADFEFSLDASGSIASTQSIRRPIDTVRILPEQDVFTDTIKVAFDIPTQQTADVEFRYTLDGSDPTLQSKLYTVPFSITETTLVKVRPFRKGLKATPWTFSGTESGKTVDAIFRRRVPLPAVTAEAPRPGLDYAYFEGDWPTLLSYAGIANALEPKRAGTAAALLDSAELAKIRATDRAYAVRYEGYLDVPTTGVYTLYAPQHLYTPTRDAGYDLRVFIDGEEWFPSPRLHAENTWSVPLASGLHRLQVAYTDYRWQTFRNEYWMAWQPEEMWQGVPVLELSGPNLEKQPLPTTWFKR